MAQHLRRFASKRLAQAFYTRRVNRALCRSAYWIAFFNRIARVGLNADVGCDEGPGVKATLSEAGGTQIERRLAAVTPGPGGRWSHQYRLSR